jgi:hypothetical protein
MGIVQQDIPAEVGLAVVAGIAVLGRMAAIGLVDSVQVRHVEQLNSVRSVMQLSTDSN